MTTPKDGGPLGSCDSLGCPEIGFHEKGQFCEDWQAAPPSPALAPSPAQPNAQVATKDDVYKAYRRGHEIGMKDGAEEAMAPAQPDALAAAEKRIADLESAIRWALGEEGEFPARPPGHGAYWWRSGLRHRARLAARREEKAAPKAGEG